MTAPRRIIVVTGTRADYGLLRPVMRAIAAHPGLELEVLVAGAHLLPPARTVDEVAAEVPVAAQIPMQTAHETGRSADAAAVGRGIGGVARHLADSPADLVLVLGDRIEAFAAAAAASVAGVRVAHVHGGDRAEGIADESLRHAITKLAHVHLTASAESARRVIALGEPPESVHEIGSPALDGLADMPPLDDETFDALGRPAIVVLLHPEGRRTAEERRDAELLLRVCAAAAPTLALHPNHDAGRDGIVQAIEAAGVPHRAHLPRGAFIGLLRRAGAIVGNSSAGLIECAALGRPCVNVGRRQAGRERPPHVIDVPGGDEAALRAAVRRALATSAGPVRHPYGDGTAGRRAAAILAGLDPARHPITKRCTF